MSRTDLGEDVRTDDTVEKASNSALLGLVIGIAVKSAKEVHFQ